MTHGARSAALFLGIGDDLELPTWRGGLLPDVAFLIRAIAGYIEAESRDNGEEKKKEKDWPNLHSPRTSDVRGTVGRSHVRGTVPGARGTVCRTYPTTT